MSAHHSLKKLTANLSPERLERINQKTDLLKKEMALQELRSAFQLSQKSLADKLKVQQPAVAKMEKRTDMSVSHLREVIEAMGGSLHIIARFQDVEVEISNFSASEM